ncbi:MAG: ribonuclease HI [Isosphaeraceae bacterium]
MEQDAAAPPDSVRLFTDGACSGNPGPGGWAFILQHPATGLSIEKSGAELDTTNNRMELTGAIEGLAALKRPCDVTLVTDSQYVAKGISEWMPKWKRQGWQRKEGNSFKPVINIDLWKRLDALVGVHRVRVEHVLGHRGHPENEACDRMAVAAYKELMRERKPPRSPGA